MIQAAGLFLFRKDGKFLVGHPTRHKADFWSIPKGKIEEDEKAYIAAIRETLEETNVDVADFDQMHVLPEVKYVKTKKVLHPFVMFENQNQFDFDKFELKCNSFVDEQKGGFPEMDDFKYITMEEAKQCLHESQVRCLDEIEKLIKKLTV